MRKWKLGMQYKPLMEISLIPKKSLILQYKFLRSHEVEFLEYMSKVRWEHPLSHLRVTCYFCVSHDTSHTANQNQSQT